MSIKTLALHRRGSSRRRGRLLGVAVAAACLGLALLASSALAAAEWHIEAEHGPTNMPPGGTGQYVVRVSNVGDASSTSPFTLTDDLPAGVTATGFGGSPYWSCSTAFPTTTSVSCTYGGPVSAPGTSTADRGVVLRPLLIDVSVDPGASGTADNVMTASGGGALTSATARDPTTFSATPAGFGFVPGSFQADVFDAGWPSTTVARQAGSHPFEARIDFALNEALADDPNTDPPTPFTLPDEHVKTLATELPAGLIGDPQATPRCTAAEIGTAGVNESGVCPANTQVGTISLVFQDGKELLAGNDSADLPVFNMTPPDGAIAALATSYLGQPVWITVSLDPANHYAVVGTVEYTTEKYWLRAAHVTLWGVPADPAHDALRRDPNATSPATGMGIAFTGAPIKPFLTLPSTCGVPGAMQVRAESWDHPGAWTPWQVGTPATMTGCDDPRFRFEPTITVQPESHATSTPTGLDVELSVPQKASTVTDVADLYAANGKDVAIGTPPLLNAKVTLPAGMSVSPSSADGLAACTPLQIGLGTNDDPTCPDASKIGTVQIDTPLLSEPLTGSVYLASQNDNPFGSLLAMYVVAKAPGVVVKLPGKVTPDPVTGQLTTTFDENPPIPFSTLHLHFNSGPRAPLVTPPTCGTMTTSADLSSWNLQLPAAHVTDSFTIDSGCSKGFDPGFTAGTKNPSAGKDSPLVTRFTRTDGDQELSKIDVSLPPGLLGHIADVVLCSNADASAGTCPDSTKIGTAVVGAGPGSHPFYITDGRVYITGPYKGAPFGLSIVVRAKAGPLDLGDVVVRAAVYVDKHTAALRVVSDPLPTILQGIPLQVRVVNITVDRPGFTFNPTNCSEMSSSATIGSTGGKSSTKSARFQVGDCSALPFAPKMTMRIGSKGHVGRGASTPLTAVVRMSPGQANLSGVKVTLPGTINARLPVINRACTLDEFEAGNCAKAKAGTAVAITPLLRDPLRGGVYFVRNGRPLPDMMVALHGTGRSSGVAVDLDAKVAIPQSKYLRTNFNTVPDVPITKFVMRLVSGSHGPVGAVTNLCTKRGRSARMGVTFRAQNGKVVHRKQRLHIRGCTKARKATGGTAGTR